LENFYKLFLSKIKFSYDSFDRIVLNGYISSFHKAGNLTFYFKFILKHLYVNKKLLFSVTENYKNVVEDFAKNNQLSCEYVEKGVRKDDFVKKYRQRFERKEKFGVYYIMKSTENESTFRVVRPNRKDCDEENYLSKTRKPFTHYYFYVHDDILGNLCIRVASYLPFKITVYLNGHSYLERCFKKKKVLYKKRDNAFLNIKDIDQLLKAKENFTPELIQERINYWLDEIGPKLEKYPVSYDYFIDQIELARNFVFKGNFFIRELFNRSCELSLQMISIDRVRQIFQSRAKVGEISTSLNRLEEGYYVFKAFFKRCSIKQYRKFSNFLRFEITFNHLPDIKIKKALEHLPLVEEKAESILDRYAQSEALMLNAHADVDYFMKHSKPLMIGKTKISAIHVYQERVNRMLEILLHDNRSIGEWKSMQLRDMIVKTFELDEAHYSRNQVIYDLRKLRAHGVVEKLPRTNKYRLTEYGMKIAVAFTVMRKKIYGPLHYSLFYYQVDSTMHTESKIERMYRRLDDNLTEIQDYLSGKDAA